MHEREIKSISGTKLDYIGIKSAEAIDFRGDNMINFESLEKNSIDLYASLKSLYFLDLDFKESMKYYGFTDLERFFDFFCKLMPGCIEEICDFEDEQFDYILFSQGLSQPIFNVVDGKRYLKEISKFKLADLEINAMESAITSVPTYIINDRFILHGGQESNTFVSFFKRVETILQKEKCGISLQKRDAYQLANAIEKLLDEQATLNSFQQSALEAADTRYNWQSEADQLFQFYKGLK